MVVCPQEIHGLALCAGAGGLELGLRIADPRTRTVCYVEQDARSAATLVARMEDESLDQAPIWSDLRSFDGKPWRGRVDIISAGYPCQPFSSAGQRKGENDPRHLWPEVARIIQETGVRRVFLENVTGHLSLGFDVVARDLQEMGFRVGAGVFSAREVGASHQRRRLFILADADCHSDGDLAGLEDWSGPILHPADVSISIGSGSGILDFALGRASGGRLVQGAAEAIFPPDPGDFAAWTKYLRKNPGLKPAVQRGPDGLADWVDRNRQVGNGVCSLAAAYAYITLSAALLR